MKKIYILILLISSLCYSQPPAGYYDSATSSGFTLKTQLKEIINDSNDGLTTEYLHTNQGYDNLFTGYVATDSDSYYENDGTVLDIYSERPATLDAYNYNHGVNQCGNTAAEGTCYNREHIFPQGFYSEQEPMRSDIHHVIPTDGFVNNGRGNLPFGVVTSVDDTYSNGSRRGGGNNYGYTGNVFEPIDEFKGDVARMMLYFAVRYEDNWNDTGWDSPTTTNNPLNGTSDQYYDTWFVSLLLDWHNSDPVSQREIDRNNAAFTYQNNRNPFIDVPAYANAIWNPSSDTEAPSAPTNLLASNPSASTIDLSWDASTDNVGVTSYDIYVDGVNTFNSVATSFTAFGLVGNTNYCFTVYARDAANNISTVSNTSCETTTGGGGSTTDLFFSEYIEGTSNNKILEIANFTGATVNLASHTIKLSANGNASWQTTYSFPVNAEILDGDVYVVANGGATVCSAEYDDLNNAITSFNGNDALGLFKNDIIIDALGTLGDTQIYAQNTTLVRRPEVVNPNTSYSPSEWMTFTSDTCDDLGTHNQTLGTESLSPSKVKFYPNPVKGNTLMFSISEQAEIKIYDILGKPVITDIVYPNASYLVVTSLEKGIYLMQIKMRNRIVTKKLIRQ
ncbi:MAG: T9SS type A sorting domain-containing protein [Flavobacteriaceae bacterium]|nr:T9SS type A sorting domain-containing protein [Flavobacteriaceae bacterium]